MILTPIYRLYLQRYPPLHYNPSNHGNSTISTNAISAKIQPNNFDKYNQNGKKYSHKYELSMSTYA